MKPLHATLVTKRLTVAACALTLLAACGSDDSSGDDVTTTPTEATVTDVTSPTSTAAPDTVAPDTVAPDTVTPDTVAATEATMPDTSGDGPGRQAVIESVMESGLNEETANCVADKIEDEYGADIFDQEEAPPDLMEKAQQFGTECAQETVSVPAGAEGRDGFVQILVSAGLTEEAATCVADKSEAEFGADFYDAPPADFQTKAQQFGEECGEELAGN